MNALPGLETHPSPIEFFDRLKWIDGKPLLDTIEPYRRDLFMRAVRGHMFRDDGAPFYNMMLAGRGKKNWKSCDLVLAGLYCLLCLESPQGNECYIIANDLKQAGDDLSLAKKLIEANADEIGDEVDVFSEEIKRVDGRGASCKSCQRGTASGRMEKRTCFSASMRFTAGAITTYLKPWHPTRRDLIRGFGSPHMATCDNSPGIPLHDLKQRGIAGDDPRMLFSWYSGGACTDPDFAEMAPEYRANPSMGLWPEGKPAVWKAADMDDQGGCLCIGCLEKRLGRTLTPKDFPRNDPFNLMPGTERDRHGAMATNPVPMRAGSKSGLTSAPRRPHA